MKTKVIALTVVILLIASLTAVYINSQKKNPSNDDSLSKPFGYNALKIDGEYVSTDIFSEENNKFFKRWSTNGEMLQKSDEERNDILLDQIIERVVLDDYVVNKSGITVTDDEVMQYIEKHIKTRFKDSHQLSAFMQSQNYSDEESMKEGIHDYLLRHRCYLKGVGEEDFTVDSKVIEEEYGMHKMINRGVDFRHIYISNSKRTDDEALALSNEIYSKLSSGESFEELVKEYSDDEGTKENGGLIKDAVYNISKSNLFDLIFEAQTGQLLSPVKMDDGYEIVYVERNEAFYRTLEEYTEILTVNEFLNSDKYKSWIEKIKKEYDIEIEGHPFKAFKLYKNNNYGEAAKEYEAAYEDENNIFYLEKACESHVLSENWIELIRVSEIGIKKAPDRIDVHLYNGHGLYKNGQTEKGLNVLKKAESIAKDNSYLLSLVHKTYTDIGLDQEAQRITDKISGKLY